MASQTLDLDQTRVAIVKPSMFEIAKVTAEYFELTVADLRGPSRKAKYAWPRQIAMTLCREIGDRSFPDIGEFFGGRDHTTILHGKRAVDETSQDCTDCMKALMRIASESSARAALRQERDRDRVDSLHLGIAFLAPAVPPTPPPPPAVDRIPIRARPVTLPSDLKPIDKKRLMGARA